MADKIAAMPPLRLRLFVMGGARSSDAAIANLQAITERHPEHLYDLEIVDVRDEPFRALSEGAVVVPTLVLFSDKGNRSLVGDLSDTATVLKVLGLRTGDFI